MRSFLRKRDRYRPRAALFSIGEANGSVAEASVICRFTYENLSPVQVVSARKLRGPWSCGNATTGAQGAINTSLLLKKSGQRGAQSRHYVSTTGMRETSIGRELRVATDAAQ
jgi:hypothetical protein